MFMNDTHVDQTTNEFVMDKNEAVEAMADTAAYEDLLHAVDAARSGLASDEHDFDVSEEELL